MIQTLNQVKIFNIKYGVGQVDYTKIPMYPLQQQADSINNNNNILGFIIATKLALSVQLLHNIHTNSPYIGKAGCSME